MLFPIYNLIVVFWIFEIIFEFSFGFVSNEH